RAASKDQDDKSPFDDWDRLDAVFSVPEPEPLVVFSRDKQLVILRWSGKLWEAGNLGTFPGDGARLSTAFTGVDGALYLFSGDQYVAADPTSFAPTQGPRPVKTRWGRPPSLF